MIDYVALKNELQTDPAALGYASVAGDDNATARLLNAATAQKIFHPRIVTARDIMDELGADAGAAILDKFEALAASNSAVKWSMKFITGVGIDMGADSFRAKIDALASALAITTDEAGLLKGMAERPGSRAEILFGAGVTITHEDIAKTRAI